MKILPSHRRLIAGMTLFSFLFTDLQISYRQSHCRSFIRTERHNLLRNLTLVRIFKKCLLFLFIIFFVSSFIFILFSLWTLFSRALKTTPPPNPPKSLFENTELLGPPYVSICLLQHLTVASSFASCWNLLPFQVLSQ